MLAYQVIDQKLQSLIKKTGKFVKKEFDSFSREDIQFKGKTDLFSYVDVQAENILTAGCSKILPGSGMIAEETGSENITEEYMWIIDPIDGTTNFIHGLPFFCISLALMGKGEILMAYTYDVLRDELFSAIKGQGAKLNGSPIQVGSAKKLEEALLGCENPKTQKGWRDNYWKMMEELLDEGRAMRRLGSAALEAAYVAAGRIDGYIEFDLKPWDVAAGVLLVREAGGIATSFEEDVDVIFGRQFLISNQHLHGKLLSIVRKWAPFGQNGK